MRAWNWGCMGFVACAVLFWAVVIALIVHFV